MGVRFDTERFVVREAKEEDIEYVMRLERAEENRDFVFQNTLEEHKRNLDSDNVFLFIAEEKEKRGKCAFILCELKKSYDSFELRRIVVDSKSRGVGSELVSALIRFAFETLEANRFWLDVFTDNNRAIHLYTKLGMLHEGTLRQSYKDYSGKYRDQMLFSILKEEYMGR